MRLTVLFGKNLDGDLLVGLLSTTNIDTTVTALAQHLVHVDRVPFDLLDCHQYKILCRPKLRSILRITITYNGVYDTKE